MGRRFTPEDKVKMMELLNSGMTMVQVAELFDTSQPYISRLKKQMYYEGDRPKINKEEIIRLYKCGYYYTEIAEKCKTTLPTVWKTIKDAGLIGTREKHKK